MSFAKFDPLHFQKGEDAGERRELFKQSVANVIVEITSHCNRTCTYCPISTVDRKSSNTGLLDDMFDKIIRDLAEIDYDQGLCFNLYNEPTSDKAILLQRISAARRALPKTRIYFSSNGDYLDNKYMKELAEAGLSEIYISVHAPAGKPYDDAYALTRFNDLSRRLGKAIKVETVRYGETIQGRVTVHGIGAHVFATNYYKLGSNRGESVALENDAGLVRTSPCDRPFHDFTISYDGTIFPCCQMFVDNLKHKSKFSVGNIMSYPTIFDAYSSKAMAGWRRGLLTFGEKASPCSTCSEDCRQGTGEEIAERERIHRTLVLGETEAIPTPTPSLAPLRLRDPKSRIRNMIEKTLRWSA